MKYYYLGRKEIFYKYHHQYLCKIFITTITCTARIITNYCELLHLIHQFRSNKLSRLCIKLVFIRPIHLDHQVLILRYHQHRELIIECSRNYRNHQKLKTTSHSTHLNPINQILCKNKAINNYQYQMLQIIIIKELSQPPKLLVHGQE